MAYASNSMKGVHTATDPVKTTVEPFSIFFSEGPCETYNTTFLFHFTSPLTTISVYYYLIIIFDNFDNIKNFINMGWQFFFSKKKLNFIG